jgi:hypothetical protein
MESVDIAVPNDEDLRLSLKAKEPLAFRAAGFGRSACKGTRPMLRVASRHKSRNAIVAFARDLFRGSLSRRWHAQNVAQRPQELFFLIRLAEVKVDAQLCRAITVLFRGRDVIMMIGICAFSAPPSSSS